MAIDVDFTIMNNAVFINTAIGGFHNEKDLHEALKSRKIWGEGLVVNGQEPMDATNSLQLLPNIGVIPHIGSSKSEARNGMAKLDAKNIVAFLNFEKLHTCANTKV